MDDVGASAAAITALTGEAVAYYTAFGFGALIIVLFAWNQFNRPSYEGARELTRLIEMLTPSTMRRRNVFWRAYLFYAAILLLIYTTLCIYGLLLGPAIGWTPPGYELDAAVGARALPAGSTPAASLGFHESGFNLDDRPPPQPLEDTAKEQSDADRYRSDPTIPLIISLIMVGLAPSFPLLLRVEEKIRFVAHHLSGIPTRLIKGGRKLHETSLQLGDGTNQLLIPVKDWQRIDHYAKAADVDDKTALHEDLEKIMAFRSWVLQEKLASANLMARDNLSRVETDVRKAVESLIFSLDTMSEFDAGTKPNRSEHAGPGTDPERRRVAWEAAARQADQVCGDICVLSMLFVEHGVLPTVAAAESFGWGRDPGEGAAELARQKYLAEWKLIQLLDAAVAYVDRENFAIALWGRVTAAILVVSLLFGMLFGIDPVMKPAESFAGDSRAVLGLNYMMQAALTYVLALLVGISWRQSAYRTNAWHNVFQSHWAQWLPPYSSAFLMSGIVAIVCVVGLNVMTAISAVGVKLVLENAWAVLRAAVEYEGLRAMLGPLLTVFVLLIVDSWQSVEKGRIWLDWLPWGTGATMFLAGGAARLVQSQVGAAGQNVEFVILSPDVWKPALSAALWACLIGLAVAFFVRGTLQYYFMNVQQQQRQVPPSLGSNTASIKAG